MIEDEKDMIAFELDETSSRKAVEPFIKDHFTKK